METVTVNWGEETFSPEPFNFFKVGPFSMTTKVMEGETPEAAMARAYSWCETMARKAYVRKRDAFLVNLKSARGGK